MVRLPNSLLQYCRENRMRENRSNATLLCDRFDMADRERSGCRA
jgi:hypothetical protein